VDTNILLRFLTGEPELQAEQARRLVEKCERGELVLKILPLVVAEAVFVLSGKFYAFSRADIAKELIQFLQTPSIEVESRDALIEALRLFDRHTIDFADAYLAAAACVEGCGLASFDQDFKKVAGLDLFEV
jgi:predicted nucleic acid-binding protein